MRIVKKRKGSTHDYSWGALGIAPTIRVWSGYLDEDISLLEQLPVTNAR